MTGKQLTRTDSSSHALFAAGDHALLAAPPPASQDPLDGKVQMFLKDYRGFQPVDASLEHDFLVHRNFRPVILRASEDQLAAAVAAFHKDYTALNAPIEGPYGDYVQVKSLGGDAFMVTAVGQKYFPLIKEAADMCVVAKIAQADDSFRYKVVLADRGLPPAGLAFPGGFCDASGPLAEAPIHAAFREFREEAGNAAKRLGVSLSPRGRSLESLEEDYNVRSVDTRATVGEMHFKARTVRMDTIPTSNEAFGKGGEVLKDGSKRVHKTTGFACVIEVPQEAANDLDSWIGAGDDAKAVQWIDITDMVNGDAGPAQVVARRKIDGEMRDVNLDAENIAFGHHFTILQILVEHLKNK